MSMRALLLLATVVCASSSGVNEDTLNSRCLRWATEWQQTASARGPALSADAGSTSCSQYCMVVGKGLHSDSSTCQLLCDASGGYLKFAAALNVDNGSPETLCKSISDSSVSMLEVGQTGSSSPTQRKVGIRGDCTIQGTLSCTVLTSPIGDVKVAGSLTVVNAIQANSATAAYVKADSGVTVSQQIVSKQDQLLIKGKIDADSVTSTGIVNYAFLEIAGVRQWALQSLEDFEEVGVDGWSHAELTECAGRKILGGHCVEKSTPELSKTFSIPADHSQVRVVAKYMFIDSWDGESGYLKADGNIVWAESYNHASSSPEHGINVCGNATPERKLFSAIDVTIPHTGNALTLSFGATTDEHSCDESFGIDSVMIFVR